MEARLGEALRWRPSWPGWGLDDGCHVTSASGALRSGSKGHVITYSPHQGDKSPAHLPAFGSIENYIDSDSFLVISLDALCSAFFCWSSLFLFGLLLQSQAVRDWTIVDGRPRFCALWSRAIRGRTVIGQNHCKLIYCQSSYCGSNHYLLRHQRYSVNKRRDCYRPWVFDHLSSYL